MKIAITNIVKNELKLIPTYLERNKDADYICLLDTGSTDGTWEYLQEQSKNNPKMIIQRKIYEDFTFDVAKNDAIGLIPDDTDIVVLLDIDEWFQEENWTDIIKNNIDLEGKRYYYSTPYLDHSTYALTGYPKISIVTRIVQTKNIKYYYPIHEVLSDNDSDHIGSNSAENVWWNKLFIQHTPDKNKDRGNYIPLCLRRINTILPVKCDVETEKIFSYLLLAHEYYRAEMYEEAKEVFNEHLVNDQDTLFDFSTNMYLMTNDKQYLRNAISMIKTQWYDQNLLYYALKDDFDWCKDHIDDIWFKIDEYENEFPEYYKKYDVLGRKIKEMAESL